LDGDITVDNAGDLLPASVAGVTLGGRVRVDAANTATPILIQTQAGDDNHSGFADLSGADAFAANIGDDLTIDTSASGGRNAGDVRLGTFDNDANVAYVHELRIVADNGLGAGTVGRLYLHGDVQLDNDAALSRALLEFAGGGEVVAAAADVRIDTNRAANADGGDIDLGSGTIYGDLVNRSLSLDARGAVDGGDIVFGPVAQGSGQFLGAFSAQTNGSGLILLDSDITVDNAGDLLAASTAGVTLGGRVRVDAQNAATPIVILTQAGDNNNSGFANLVSATVFAADAGDDLTVDTSSSVDDAGDVSLSVFSNDTGNASYIHQLRIAADNGIGGGDPGDITIGDSALVSTTIRLDDDGAGNAALFEISDGSGSIILANNVEIDTEQGNTAGVNGGAVDFGTSPVTGDSTRGRDLTIDTSTGGANATDNGGAVFLAGLVDADGAAAANTFVHRVTIDTSSANGAAGALHLTGATIHLDDDGTAVSSFVLLGNGDVIVEAASVDFNTEQGDDRAGGNVDLGASNIYASAPGHDLTIDTRGVGTGGAVTFGLVDDNAGTNSFVNDFSVDTRSTTSGVIALSRNILVDDQGVTDPGSVSLAGKVVLTGVAAVSNVTIDSEQGGNPLGGDITINGTVDADDAAINDRALTLNSEEQGIIFVTGDLGVGGALAGLTIKQSNGATFLGKVNVTDATGHIEITDTKDNMTVAFENDLTTNGLSVLNTGADNYNVKIVGGVNSIGGTTVFSNGGTVTLGDDGGSLGDKTTFLNGVTAEAPSGVSIAGLVAANSGDIKLGDANTGVIATADVTVGGASTGLIRMGDAQINDNVTLTVGTGIANAINLDAVNGMAGGATSRFVTNTTGILTLAESVGTTSDALIGITDIGTIMLTAAKITQGVPINPLFIIAKPSGGDGLIELNVAKISADSFAPDNFDFGNVLIATNKGQISQQAFAFANSRYTAIDASAVLVPPPALTLSQPIATVIGEVVDLASSFGYEVWADWSEGNSVYLRLVQADSTGDGLLNGTEQWHFMHGYGINPTGNPASDILMLVYIKELADGSIIPTIGGQALVGDVVLNPNGSVTSSAIGIFEILTIDVLTLQTAPSTIPAMESMPAPIFAPPVLAANVEAANTLPQRGSHIVVASAAGVTTEGEERYYELRIVVVDEAGELDDKKIRINLNKEDLKAIYRFDPSKLPELFRRLPADRYRIYLIEDGTERMILDFIIQQGQPIETPEQETLEIEEMGPRDNATDAHDSAELQNADDRPVARLEQATPRQALLPTGDTTTRRDSSLFAERLGNASFVSHGGVVLGAAALSYAASDRWEKSVERLMERFDRRRHSPGLRRTKPQSMKPGASQREPIYQ
jgi:hypothetical protein